MRLFDHVSLNHVIIKVNVCSSLSLSLSLSHSVLVLFSMNVSSKSVGKLKFLIRSGDDDLCYFFDMAVIIMIMIVIFVTQTHQGIEHLLDNRYSTYTYVNKNGRMKSMCAHLYDHYQSIQIKMGWFYFRSLRTCTTNLDLNVAVAFVLNSMFVCLSFNFLLLKYWKPGADYLFWISYF